MHPITTQTLTLSVGDGTTMGAYLARPEGAGPFPAMIVLQEIFGVNAHIRSIADRFAKAGYVALAPELFHRTGPGFESGYDDVAPGMAHAEQLSTAGVLADLQAAHAWLAAEPAVDAGRMAAVGFCMGGRLAFVASTVLPLQAAISFYGGGIAQTQLDRVEQVNAPLLLFWAGRDQLISAADQYAVQDALRKADKTYVSIEFGTADHGFFCEARGSYDPAAAQPAWALTQAFLDEHLGKGAAVG